MAARGHLLPDADDPAPAAIRAQAAGLDPLFRYLFTPRKGPRQAVGQPFAAMTEIAGLRCDKRVMAHVLDVDLAVGPALFEDGGGGGVAQAPSAARPTAAVVKRIVMFEPRLMAGDPPR